MTTVDDKTRRAITTSLNVGEKPRDIAKRYGVPIRAVTELAKARHRFREPRMLEGAGKILHAVGVLAKWCERPEREDDARRRAASKKLTDELLKRHGLTAPKNPIIIPDSAPAGASWGRRKARRKP